MPPLVNGVYEPEYVRTLAQEGEDRRKGVVDLMAEEESGRDLA